MNNKAQQAKSNQGAHDPFSWLKQARELDQAAMLIWMAIRDDFVRMSAMPVGTRLDLKDFPNQGLGGVFWLNAGLAIENLFKGIVIQDNPALVVNGFIDPSLTIHRLIDLATKASINLDVTDAFFLEIATECVLWAGRYPCSLKPNKRKPPVFSEADVIAYRRIFTLLSNRFVNAKSKSTVICRIA